VTGRGKLVYDDSSGYKNSFTRGVTEIGCAAHARRKFFDLHANHQSEIVGQALKYFGALYEIEDEAADLDPDARRTLRQTRSRPVLDALHAWMSAQRRPVPEGSAIAKALDYSLNRWEALTRYLDDGHVPMCNTWVHAAGGMTGIMPTPELCRLYLRQSCGADLQWRTARHNSRRSTECHECASAYVAPSGQGSGPISTVGPIAGPPGRLLIMPRRKLHTLASPAPGFAR
jgi:hypothetical protein